MGETESKSKIEEFRQKISEQDKKHIESHQKIVKDALSILVENDAGVTFLAILRKMCCRDSVKYLRGVSNPQDHMLILSSREAVWLELENLLGIDSKISILREGERLFNTKKEDK